MRFADHGNTRIAYIPLNGKLQELVGDVGGTSIGRPYASGSFSVARDGSFAFTQTRPEYPADVVAGRKGSSETTRLTRLNADLFEHRELGQVEEFRFDSSHDGREVQGWIVKPPGFDPKIRARYRRRRLRAPESAESWRPHPWSGCWSSTER